MFEILHALAKFAVRWNIFKASRNSIWLVKYLWPCNISAIHWDLVDSRLDLIANDLEAHQFHYYSTKEEARVSHSEFTSTVPSETTQLDNRDECSPTSFSDMDADTQDPKHINDIFTEPATPIYPIYLLPSVCTPPPRARSCVPRPCSSTSSRAHSTNNADFSYVSPYRYTPTNTPPRIREPKPSLPRPTSAFGFGENYTSPYRYLPSANTPPRKTSQIVRSYSALTHTEKEKMWVR